MLKASQFMSIKNIKIKLSRKLLNNKLLNFVKFRNKFNNKDKNRIKKISSHIFPIHIKKSKTNKQISLPILMMILLF